MAKQNQQADEEFAPGTVIDGRYRVVRSIGQGGNGMVYEVEHTRTGRHLALKALLDEGGFARLEQEARAASLMKNGHTARIIDMEPSGSAGPYMVMELLEGQSLRGLLDEAGQLPLELTVNIAMQCCECLHEAHGLGIIHRDLKPENVFLCASPWPGQYDVKVLDFGVMKVAEGGGAIPKSSLTRTGSTVGTPYYMSLEQLRNSSAVDARADVYSLGVVLYECLSGRKPFQAETIGDLVYALCSGPPMPLARLRPDLPQEIGDLVMRTLSANRDDRPANMMDMAAALLTYANAAFALWVKVDGKQPALTSRPLAGEPAGPAKRPGVPRPTMTEVAPVPQTAPPPMDAGPRAATPALAAPPVLGGVATAPTMTPAQLAAEEAPPATNLAWPPPDAEAGGRRDTPTEMYVKGVHGAPPGELEPAAAATGDRDTPTRAYELPVGRAPLLATMKSPVSVAGGAEEVDVKAADFDGNAPTGGGLSAGPRFGAPPMDLAAPPGALLTMPLSKQTVPLGNVMRGLSPAQVPPSATPLPGPTPLPVPPRAKPGWQVALDRALIGVGGAAENTVRRFRSAPPNTQIIIMIVAGTVLVLLIGLIVFLATR